MKTPRTRFLNVQPYGGGFLLSDPYGVSAEVVVTPQMLLLLSLMDGKRSEEDIRAEFLRRTGTILTEEEFREILSFLDRGGYLLSEEFLRRLEEKKKRMLGAGVKEPFHAGSAYPEKPEDLRLFLEKNLQAEERESPLGILVPHMDLRVAAPTYGKVYGRIARKPETILVMGVAHYIHETHLSVCPLDFKTPLGTLEVDREIVERMRNLFEHDILHDILSYEREHSIEFQTIFLKHLFPEAKVVPLIVSWGDEDLLRKTAERITRAIEDRDVMLVASVDLSHVGRKFGDERSYDPSFRDREYLNLLSALDSEASFRLLASDQNRTRIDGQFTNFVFLEVLKNLGASKGKEIDYSSHYEELTDSVVTYAGMTFL